MTSVSEYIKTPSDVAPTLDRFQEMIQKYQFMQTNVESRINGLMEKIPEMRSNLEAVRFLARKRESLLRSVRSRGVQNGDGESGDELDEIDDVEEGEGEDGLDGLDGDASTPQPRRTPTHSLPTTFQLNPTLHAYASIPLVQTPRSQSTSTTTTTTTISTTTTTSPFESSEDSFKVHLWLGANTLASYTLSEAQTLLQSKLDTAERTLATSEEDVGFLREQITGLEVAVARVWNWDVGEKRRRRTEEESKGGKGQAKLGGEGR